MQFDGVGFNDDIPKKMTKEAFIKHEMHANHYRHLNAEEKEKILSEAYDLMAKTGEVVEVKKKEEEQDEEPV